MNPSTRSLGTVLLHLQYSSIIVWIYCQNAERTTLTPLQQKALEDLSAAARTSDTRMNTFIKTLSRTCSLEIRTSVLRFVCIGTFLVPMATFNKKREFYLERNIKGYTQKQVLRRTLKERFFKRTHLWCDCSIQNPVWRLYTELFHHHHQGCK